MMFTTHCIFIFLWPACTFLFSMTKIKAGQMLQKFSTIFDFVFVTRGSRLELWKPQFW